MHELFDQVLREKDLSKAGDLFSLEDRDIEGELSEVLRRIEEIASTKGYLHNDNDQSVVEICITRVTSAIRETSSIERHAPALVHLLESCLQHPVTPTNKDDEPPHAKIASDILSCVFLNYSKRSVMEQVLPVAVRFLQQGNCELSRNLSSYLSLAAIDNAKLLAAQIHLVLDSIVIHKNRGLSRVLPQIYEENKPPVQEQVGNLIHLLPDCDTAERSSILQLCSMVAHDKPRVLEAYIPLLCAHLSSTATASMVLQTFATIATANAEPFSSHVGKLKQTVEQQPTTLSSVAKILGAVGKLNQLQSKECVTYLVSQLESTDNHTQPILLKEVKAICECYPSVLPPVITSITPYSQTGPVSSRMVIQQLKDLCSKSTPGQPERKTVGSQTDGIVTVITIGNMPQARQPKSDHVTILAPTTSTSLPHSKNASTSTREIPSMSPVKHIPPSQPASNFSSVSSGLSPRDSRDGPSPSVLSSQTTGVFPSMSSVTSSRDTPHPGIPPHHPVPVSSVHNARDSRAHLANLPPASGDAAVHPHSHPAPAATTLPSTRYPSSFSIKSSSPSVAMATTSSGSSALLLPTATSMGVATVPAVAARQTSMTQLPPERPTLSGAMTTVVTSVATITRTTIAGSKAAAHSAGESGERRPIATVTTTTTPTYPQAIPYRDAVQQFCEKHLAKIKAYIDTVLVKLPLPIKATMEERKHKRRCRLHFICCGHEDHCLYQRNFFTHHTKNPRLWIHLMFLATQARSQRAVSQQDPSVGNLKATWDTLKTDSGNSFVRLVTSSFPTTKDHECLLQELHSQRYFDVFEFNAAAKHWACFMCNHPEKALGLLQDGLPSIEGQLKEKKGKWKIFKRWKTRYFTLSGAAITYSKTGQKKETLPISKIQSVKAVRKGMRDIPKAFEIFTNDQSYVLKAKDGKNAEEWVQCLHIAVSKTQKQDSGPQTMTELENMVQSWSNATRVNHRSRRAFVRLNDTQTKL